MLRAIVRGKTVRWVAFAAVGLGAVAVAVTGCQVRNIRQMYSKEFNCPEDDVQVESIASDRYRVSGCEPIIYQCVSGTCMPVREDTAASNSESAADRSASAREDKPQPKGVKAAVEKSPSGQNIVKVVIPLGNATYLKLSSAPTGNAGAVQFVLIRQEEEPELQDCDLGMMVNGQRIATPATKKARNDSQTMLVLKLPRTTAQELGLARQLSLRACDNRWTLNAEQLTKIHDFTSLYEEELAWSGDAKTGTGGLVAPASGWGEWKVAEPMPSASTSGAELQGQALFQLISPSVFQVEAQSAEGTTQGSAVAISRTDVLTNCHVIQGARKITLKQKKDKWLVQIGRSDPGTDRCVLHAENTKFAPIRGVRAYGDLKAGEPLLTLGSPSGLELTISNGILSGLREIQGQKFIQTTAPISPGSSGGGLFDSRGNLVGITTLTLPGEKKLNQSLNFAIAADLYWQQ